MELVLFDDGSFKKCCALASNSRYSRVARQSQTTYRSKTISEKLKIQFLQNQHYANFINLIALFVGCINSGVGNINLETTALEKL